MRDKARPGNGGTHPQVSALGNQARRVSGGAVPNKRQADHGSQKAGDQNVQGVGIGVVHNILHQHEENVSARPRILYVAFPTPQTRNALGTAQVLAHIERAQHHCYAHTRIQRYRPDHPFREKAYLPAGWSSRVWRLIVAEQHVWDSLPGGRPWRLSMKFTNSWIRSTKRRSKAHGD